MTHRIILCSLLAASSIMINAMNHDREEALKAIDAAAKQFKDTAPKSEEDILQIVRQFKALTSLNHQLTILAQQEANKVVTPEKLQQYVEDVKAIGIEAVNINSLYRAYLGDKATSQSEKSKIQAHFDQYTTALKSLRERKNIAYSTYWATPATRASYVTHPEFRELCLKVIFAQNETKEIESSIGRDIRQELFKSDLLLSTPINALYETLTTLKLLQTLPK